MPVLAQGSGKIKVTATIRPLHSIAAAIMEGVGAPKLLLAKSHTAHHANLRPSQAKILSQSDLILWIGPQMENFLTSSINILGKNSTIVNMMQQEEIVLLKLPNGTIDGHIWLSLSNTASIARIIKQALSAKDPLNAGKYASNLVLFEGKLKKLTDELDRFIDFSRRKNFLIFHDALGYLEEQFNFNTRSILQGNEELNLSAKQISAAGKLATSGKYQCLIIEPNSRATAITQIARQAGMAIGVADPIGINIKPGPNLYSMMMLNLVQAIINCSK